MDKITECRDLKDNSTGLITSVYKQQLGNRITIVQLVKYYVVQYVQYSTT